MFQIGIVINVTVTGVRRMFMRDCGGDVEVRARRHSQTRRNESLEQKGDNAYKHHSVPAIESIKRRYLIHGLRADEGELGTGRKSESNENSDTKYADGEWWVGKRQLPRSLRFVDSRYLISGQPTQR